MTYGITLRMPSAVRRAPCAVRRPPCAVRRGRQYLNNHWADLAEILCEHTCRYLVDAELFIFSILSF